MTTRPHRRKVEPLSEIIRTRWNDTEKISMASAQGCQPQTGKRQQCVWIVLPWPLSVVEALGVGYFSKLDIQAPCPPRNPPLSIPTLFLRD